MIQLCFCPISSVSMELSMEVKSRGVDYLLTLEGGADGEKCSQSSNHGWKKCTISVEYGLKMSSTI